MAAAALAVSPGWEPSIPATAAAVGRRRRRRATVGRSLRVRDAEARREGRRARRRAPGRRRARPRPRVPQKSPRAPTSLRSSASSWTRWPLGSASNRAQTSRVSQPQSLAAVSHRLIASARWMRASTSGSLRSASWRISSCAGPPSPPVARSARASSGSSQRAWPRRSPRDGGPSPRCTGAVRSHAVAGAGGRCVRSSGWRRCSPWLVQRPGQSSVRRRPQKLPLT